VSGGAVALALGAAVLHAGWNVLLAGSRDTGAATAGVLIFGVALLAVPALVTGGVSAEAIPFIAASAALELVYFVLLARAYAGGELSVVYPIARGSAPVVVLVFGAIALRESVPFAAAVGVLTIAAGVLLVGLGAFPLRPTRLLTPRPSSMPTRLRISVSSLRRARRFTPPSRGRGPI
jgi:multidrug transporter EmrE-like cation transporter